MYIPRTCRQVLNRWSIRSCGSKKKRHFRRTTPTYIQLPSSVQAVYILLQSILLPCWYPIQTQYHGCHSWSLNVVITQNWVYTHIHRLRMRTGRGQLWLNFIFKHVFYLLCIVHLETHTKKKKLRSEMRQFGAVVESLLTSMLLFSHGR